MPDTLALQCVSDFTVHDDGRIAGHKLFAGTKLGGLGFLRDDNPFILPFNGSVCEFSGECDQPVQWLELGKLAIEPDVENGVLFINWSEIDEDLDSVADVIQPNIGECEAQIGILDDAFLRGICFLPDIHLVVGAGRQDSVFPENLGAVNQCLVAFANGVVVNKRQMYHIQLIFDASGVV